jgi:prolyl-tRNA synthetase
MREVSTFKEAHTAHATVEEANAQVETAVGIYKRFFDEIGVPYLISQRPEWDKFAGAERSIAFDMICPDGRSLQIGTVHNLGQNFSKSFDIAYETRDGKREHVWQTCYGVSGRAIAAVLIVHGDDHGLVLPPKMAPIQVVVVPIPSENEKEEIIKQCEEIAKLLRKNDVRVELDLRTDLTPGAKFYYWELRGVLLRVEIGPKEIKRKEVTIVRRDTLEKNAYKKSELVDITRKLIIETTKDLRRRAWQWMNEHIHRVDNLEDVRRVLERRMGVIEVSWCGNSDCGSELEEKINARILGIPLNVKEKGEIEKCVCCGRKASHIIRIASAY